MRFVPTLKTTWLALKRHGVPRDLRRKITNFVASRVFEWESDALRKERMVQQRFLLSIKHQYVIKTKIMGEIISSVEPVPDPADWLPGLWLQRVKLRRRYYSRPVFEWLWLET